MENPSQEESSLTASDTMVRYLEVWLPNEERTELQLQSTAFADGDAHVTESHGTTVGNGEGLVGSAWQQKSAVIVKTDNNEPLSQSMNDYSCPLSAALAIPVFRQHSLCGMVVLGFGKGHGAAEVWRRDNRDELAVETSHYQGLPSFEFISRYTRFPKGAGVPGKVWASGRPTIAQNPEGHHQFIRSFGSESTEINAAIGLPIDHANGFPNAVLLLLNSIKQPYATQTDLVQLMSSPDEATCVESVVTVGRTQISEIDDRISEVVRQLTTAAAPVVVPHAPSDSGLRFTLAIPTYDRSGLYSALLLSF